MFISVRTEGLFCKCINASFPPFLSSLTGFYKLICVFIHSLSCHSHCANTLEFDPILILSQKWEAMPVQYTARLYLSNLDQVPEHLGLPQKNLSVWRSPGMSVLTWWGWWRAGMFSGHLWQSQPAWITYYLTDACLWDFCLYWRDGMDGCHGDTQDIKLFVSWNKDWALHARVLSKQRAKPFPTVYSLL